MTAATYNGDGQRESDTIGGTVSDFVWNTVGTLPKVIMDSSNAYIYTNYVAPTEQVSLATGAITYLLADRLGSVRGAINSAGALTGTASYDAWGNPNPQGGLSSATPFGFAGALVRLCAMAARASQAALAVKTPDGAWASGPSVRSAKTVSVRGKRRWAYGGGPPE